MEVIFRIICLFTLKMTSTNVRSRNSIETPVTDNNVQSLSGLHQPGRSHQPAYTIGIKIHVRNKPVEVYTLIQNWNVAFFLVVDGERRKTSFPALQFFFLTFLLHDKFQSGLDCAGWSFSQVYLGNVNKNLFSFSGGGGGDLRTQPLSHLSINGD